jgi:hypothetical protein
VTGMRENGGNPRMIRVPCHVCIPGLLSEEN